MTGRPASRKYMKCPSCKGDGLFLGLKGARCMWCGGRKRVPKEAAIRFANTQYTLAGGGYIAGDYSLEECRKEEADAAAIYQYFGVVAPWIKGLVK